MLHFKLWSIAFVWCWANVQAFAQTSNTTSVKPEELKNYKQLTDVLAIPMDTNAYSIHSFDLLCEAKKQTSQTFVNRGNMFETPILFELVAAVNGKTYTFLNVKVVRKTDQKVLKLAVTKKLRVVAESPDDSYILPTRTIKPSEMQKWNTVTDVFSDISFASDIEVVVWIYKPRQDALELRMGFDVSQLRQITLRPLDHLIFMVYKVKKGQGFTGVISSETHTLIRQQSFEFE